MGGAFPGLSSPRGCLQALAPGPFLRLQILQRDIFKPLLSALLTPPTLPVLPPFPEDPCDDRGPTQTTQETLPVSRSFL